LKGRRGEGRRILGEEDMVVLFEGSKLQGDVVFVLPPRFDSSFYIFLFSEIPGYSRKDHRALGACPPIDRMSV
jgi:hypothetical protein